MAQQRGGLRWEVQAADAGAEGVSRRAFFGRNLAAEPFVASVPDRCAKNILYGAVIAAVCVACAHMHL